MFKRVPARHEVADIFVPCMEQVLPLIPYSFIDNGCSDPTKFLTHRFMSKEVRDIVEMGARGHTQGIQSSASKGPHRA